MSRGALTLVLALGLAAGTPAADDDAPEPITVDLHAARPGPDGRLTIDSFVRQAPDGSLVFANGRRMSRKAAVERAIADGNARTRDGRRIDPGSVTVREDGAIVTRGGEVLNPSAARVPSAAPPAQGSGAAGEAPVVTLATPEERPPASPVAADGPGIALIAGGRGRNGVAAVRRLPVLD